MTDDPAARLEAAVRASWGYDDLCVYADHLQAIGDPRGEVMALDRVAPRDRNAPGATAWRDQRRAAIGAWVGHALIDQVGPLVELGFIKELVEPADAVLASPAGDVIRAYDGQQIEALAARARPWLERLVLRGTAYAEAEVARLIAHTPRLALLDLHGATTFPHPGVRYLKTTGGGGRIAMPAVTHLDLWVVDPDAPVAETTPEDLPALVSLDLARCAGGALVAFTELAARPVCRQIEHVTLPALADDPALLAAANRLLDAMPALRTARLARAYAGPRFGDSLAERRPPVALATPFPWPAPATLTQYNTLVFEIPEEPFNDIVALPPLIAFLEQHYEGFAPATRAAWTTVFEHVRPNDAQWTDDGDWIAPEDRPPVTVATVARAIEACDALAAWSWVEFRAHFRDARRGLLDMQPIRVSMYR